MIFASCWPVTADGDAPAPAGAANHCVGNTRHRGVVAGAPRNAESFKRRRIGAGDTPKRRRNDFDDMWEILFFEIL